MLREVAGRVCESIALLARSRDSTIFLGSPFGRVRNPSLGLPVFRNGTAIGIVLFLLWDVLAHAVEPVEAALTEVRDPIRPGTWPRSPNSPAPS